MSTTETQEIVHVLPSVIQVLVAGPVQQKKYQDREYTTQQLECLALDDAGQPLQVGVIRVPKALQGTVKPGFYRPVYAMRVDRERNIQPFISDLTPYKPAGSSAAVAPSKSASSSAAST